MKMVKKSISLLVVATMIISLFSTMAVSAAWQYFSMDFSDIVTYSYDINVPEGQVLGIEFTAPRNLAAASLSNWSYGAGSVKMAQGKIQAGKAWLSSDNNTIVSPYTEFPAGQVNNFMLRKNHRTGYIEFLVNGVSFYKGTMDFKTLPISMLNIHGSAASTATIENVFNKGTVEGELGAVAKFDEDKKEITVYFTEGVSAETDFSGVVLKKANDNETATIPVTAVNDGVKAVFTYEGELSALTEYIVVLPDGLTGNLGGTIRNYPKFTTDAVSVHQYYDFNDCSPTNNPKIWKMDGPNYGATGDAAYGQALPFKTKDETGTYYSKIEGIDIPADDVFSISYDTKVMVDSIKMGWMLWQQGGKAANICYGVTSAGVNYSMLQIDDDANVNGGWLGDGTWQNKIGTYKNGQWINYKWEFNRKSKTVKIYVDGDLKTENALGVDVVPAGYTQVNGGNSFIVSVVSNSAPQEAGKIFMYMDNFKVETYANPAIVSGASFVDARGNEAVTGGKISRLLDKVNVNFASTMNADTLTAETVKLYYGETAVDCTRAYDSTNKVYTLTPATIPPANAEVKVVVSGAKTTGGGDVAPFEAKVTADNQESKFVVYETDAVNETDVKPFNGNLSISSKLYYNKYYPTMSAANFTDEVKNVVLIAAEYSAEGKLLNVNVSKPITMNPGDYIRYGGKVNGDNVIDAKSDTATIKTFVWDTLENAYPMGKHSLTKNNKF